MQIFLSMHDRELIKHDSFSLLHGAAEVFFQNFHPTAPPPEKKKSYGPPKGSFEFNFVYGYNCT